MSVKMFLENGYFLPLYNTSKIFVKLQKNGCIFFFILATSTILL